MKKISIVLERGMYVYTLILNYSVREYLKTMSIYLFSQNAKENLKIVFGKGEAGIKLNDL